MKKKFLLVSMIAAAMLTASCSKEESGDNSEQPVNIEQQIVQNTRPIVIKVDKKTSLSKVGTSDGYDLTFSADDKLVLTDGTNNYAELNLQAGDEGKSTATFTGNISTDADGTEIYATIGSPLEGVQTSSTSLADVVAANCYLKSAAFTYSQASELSVELSDQNAYLVFSVAEGQKKVNIGGENDWYPTESNIVNRTLYVAVPAGNVSGRFFGTKTLESSKIYTITRTDVVDLGQTVDGKKILWKTTNETENPTSTYNGTDTRYNGQAYYTFSTAKTTFETSNAPIEGSSFRLPTKNELKALENIKNSPQSGESYSFNGGATFTTAYGSVFFPAASAYGGGAYGGHSAGDLGIYWSGEPGAGGAWYLVLLSSYAGVDAYCAPVNCEYSVRLVRGL